MKNKEKPIVFDIDISIFNGLVTVCICSKERFIDWLRQNSFDEGLILDISRKYSNLEGCVISDDVFDVIYIKNIDCERTIAHEILHFVIRFLKDKGMSLSSDSEETYTYLMGYITEMFYKNKEKYGKKLHV